MRVIAKKHLITYWGKHPDAEQPLKAWYDEAVKAQWSTPQDIKAQYGNASFVGNNRVVFNIKGNNYRLIVKINYHYQMLWIRFIGTHAQYDKIDATKI